MINEWLKRKRNSLGYGVQSPGDFYFVQHVLLEQAPYYGYEVLRELHQQQQTYLPFYSEATNRLLFRIANYMHPSTIIEIGAGLSTLAMATACPSSRCIAITSSDECYSALQSLLSAFPKIELKKGDEMVLFGQSLREQGTRTLLHIAHTPYYKEIVDTALPHITNRALIIIEDIRANKEKLRWWESIQKDPSTGTTYDLGNIGLLQLDPSRYKNRYWINLKR